MASFISIYTQYMDCKDLFCGINLFLYAVQGFSSVAKYCSHMLLLSKDVS